MLTVHQIEQLRPWKRNRWIEDGCGLYLLVKPDGNKTFRYVYDYRGSRRGKQLGFFPEMSPAVARGYRDDCQRLLAEGKSPRLITIPHQFNRLAPHQEPKRTMSENQDFVRASLARIEASVTLALGRLDRIEQLLGLPSIDAPPTRH
jgi:hypothetical protein